MVNRFSGWWMRKSGADSRKVSNVSTLWQKKHEFALDRKSPGGKLQETVQVCSASFTHARIL